MLMTAVNTYLAVRRASGFALRNQGFHLKCFAAFSESRGHHHIRAVIAIEWARLGRSRLQRARRLGTVVRFARYLHAEDQRHEVPPAIFGTETAAKAYSLHPDDDRYRATHNCSRRVDVSRYLRSNLQHVVRLAGVHRTTSLRSHSAARRRHHAQWLGD
jgi:hypothetical protein